MIILLLCSCILGFKLHPRSRSTTSIALKIDNYNRDYDLNYKKDDHVFIHINGLRAKRVEVFDKTLRYKLLEEMKGKSTLSFLSLPRNSWLKTQPFANDYHVIMPFYDYLQMIIM